MQVLQNFEQSNIACIKYNDESCVLHLIFHNGSIHQYLNVSAETWQSLTLATQKIKYLKTHVLKCHKLIKQDKVPTGKINRWL